MRRVLMLVNPTFSALRLRSIPHIRRLLESSGIAVEQAATGPHRAAAATARDAVSRGIDAILTCGGDGTVFDVLQGVAGTGVPIGVLPFGTGNVLVQNLGLPRSPLAAARALLTARPIQVPLGMIECSADHPASSSEAAPTPPSASPQRLYFAMSAGVGGHAAMMRSAYRYAKHRTGRLAYFAAGIEILAAHPLTGFELDLTTTDGQHLHQLASELIALRVGQLNLWRTGGGLLRPSLRVAWVQGDSRLRLARAAFESLLMQAGDRSPRHRGAASYDDARTLTITPPPGLALPLEADGEIVATVTHAAPATLSLSSLSATFLSARA